MAASTSTAASTSMCDEYGDLTALAAELPADDDESWLAEINIDDPAKVGYQQSQLYGDDSDFDKNAGSSWIFPVSYEKRDYQLNISRVCLFTNTLVCLPTGLGKTFIASVVIYNFYRWFPRSKIIFMAPSRPLVNQQIKACYDIVGIPANETAELTGRIATDKRMALWNSKRVFFATPQTIENDIRDPAFPVNSVKLVVVDEAHKAKGGYAYCKVVEGINAVNKKFRVVALSATPGKTQDVIEICQNLLIAKIEARDETSIDVRPYKFAKTIDVVKVELGELAAYRDRFVAIVDPHIRKLFDYQVIRSLSLSKGAMFLQYKEFQSKPHPNKTEINGIFSLLVSLLSSLESLERHGIQIFLNTFVDDKNATGMKYFVSQDRNLKLFLDELNEKYKASSPLAVSVHPLPSGEIPSTAHLNLDFGHPKYEILKQKVTEYLEAGGTKLIIFCELRSTADLIYKLLLQLRPLVLPAVLIGQGDKISQTKQLSVMADFRSDKANTLVTTSVCEEGIDVGDVDLVICFDVNSKNPTRFVQRIGRTGRKRNGRVIMLASEGPEEEMIRKLIRSMKNLNRSIHNNSNIKNNLYKLSPRLVPAAFNPTIIETKFSIPEVVEDVKPTVKSKKAVAKKAVKAPKATKGIAAHFKPVPKKATQPSNEPMEVDDEVFQPADIVPATTTAVMQAPPAPILSTFELCEKAKNNFVRQIALLSAQVTEPDILRYHLEVSSQNALKLVDRLIHFNETFNEVNLSRLDLECESLLEKTIVDKKTSESAEVSTDSQPDQFIEVESRYGNQFTIPEQFNSPFFSSPFFRNENITPIRRPQSGFKNSASVVKKSPKIENSPLMKAFAKQRVMSTSTPVSRKVSTSIFSRTDPELPGPSVQAKVPVDEPGPSTSVQKARSTLFDRNPKPSSSNGTREVSQREKSVLDFFGLKSIDDIFEGLGSDDEDNLMPPPATSLPEVSLNPPAPDASSITSNKRKQIEETIQSVFSDGEEELPLRFDEEIIDSSVFEAPSKKRKIDADETNCVVESTIAEACVVESSVSEAVAEKFNRFDLELAQSGKNNEVDGLQVPENVDDDSLDKTQVYDLDQIFEIDEAPSEMKENVQVVNVVLIDSPSPKKNALQRPKPNISRLISALHTSNFLQSSVAVDNSPVLRPQNAPEFKSPASPALRTQNVRFKSPAPSTSMQSPVSSRVIRNKKLQPDSDTASDPDTPSSIALPVRRKVKRRHKVHRFFDTQAGVDGSESSDEDEAAIEEMQSFIADDTQQLTQCTQAGIDMQAKYIESLRSPSARQNANFKIPAALPPMRHDIFSQVPQEDEEKDWELDSFVVNNDEVSEDSEVDELEIAEQILKNKRKQARLKKTGIKKRKVLRPEDSSDDEEIEKMRRELSSK